MDIKKQYFSHILLVKTITLHCQAESMIPTKW